MKQLQIDKRICTCRTRNENLIELKQIFSSFRRFIRSKAIEIKCYISVFQSDQKDNEWLLVIFPGKKTSESLPHSKLKHRLRWLCYLQLNVVLAHRPSFVPSSWQTKANVFGHGHIHLFLWCAPIWNHLETEASIHFVNFNENHFGKSGSVSGMCVYSYSLWQRWLHKKPRKRRRSWSHQVRETHREIETMT